MRKQNKSNRDNNSQNNKWGLFNRGNQPKVSAGYLIKGDNMRVIPVDENNIDIRNKLIAEGKGFWEAQMFPTGGCKYNFNVTLNIGGELLDIFEKKYGAGDWIAYELPQEINENVKTVFSEILNEQKFDMSKPKVFVGKNLYRRGGNNDRLRDKSYFNFSIKYESHAKSVIANPDGSENIQYKAAMIINLHLLPSQTNESNYQILNTFDELHQYISDNVLNKIYSEDEKQKLQDSINKVLARNIEGITYDEADNYVLRQQMSWRRGPK